MSIKGLYYSDVHAIFGFITQNMLSDIVFTWHSRLYAAFSPVNEKLPQATPFEVKFELEGRQLLEEFQTSWNVTGYSAWWQTAHSDLFDAGKSMFGSGYLAMSWGDYVPLEITYTTVDEIPDNWRDGRYSKRQSFDLLSDDDVVLQVKIMPEYEWAVEMFAPVIPMVRAALAITESDFDGMVAEPSSEAREIPMDKWFEMMGLTPPPIEVKMYSVVEDTGVWESRDTRKYRDIYWASLPLYKRFPSMGFDGSYYANPRVLARHLDGYFDPCGNC